MRNCVGICERCSGRTLIVIWGFSREAGAPIGARISLGPSRTPVARGTVVEGLSIHEMITAFGRIPLPDPKWMPREVVRELGLPRQER